jgi:hypothetical protein
MSPPYGAAWVSSPAEAGTVRVAGFTVGFRRPFAHQPLRSTGLPLLNGWESPLLASATGPRGWRTGNPRLDGLDFHAVGDCAAAQPSRRYTAERH